MLSHATIRAVGWVSSIGLHLGSALLLLAVPIAIHADPHRSEVSFSVASATRAVAPASRTPAPNVSGPSRPIAKLAIGSSAPTPVMKAMATSEPLDMTGVTLTGTEGASWASMTGNGQAMRAPIVQNVVATPPADRSKTTLSNAPSLVSRPEPTIVPVKDLSSKPVAPTLDTQLLSNYPIEAKRLGIAGRAVVIARIDTDGVVRTTSILTESAAGFGAACQKTVRGSRWTEPRDKDGKPVHTQVNYTCDFRVDG